ncbi:MAG: ABC transporter substrate-binding protein [Pseudolabrys sp.]
MGVRRTRRSVLAGLAVAAMLATGDAAAETRLSFTLDSPIRGPSAPFLTPLDSGAYKAEGLNVSIEPAADAMEPITRVASGAFDMGFADVNALIRFRDANPKTPVKAVFMVYNRPAYAIIARKSRGIAGPKDLEGKKIGAPAADPAAAQWPLFAQLNGIDAGKVTIENVGMPVREPMLTAGQVDAITGLTFRSYINLKDRGVPLDDIVVLLMADHGVELYGNAIIVNPKFAAENPEAVRGFLRAYLKSLKETVRRPGRAVDSVLKREEGLKRTTEFDRLSSAIHDSIATPEVRANGYGDIDRVRFARAIDQIAQAYKFKNEKPKPDDIFDASFLPAAGERRYP